MEEFKYLIPEESGIVVSMDVEKLREVEVNLRDVFTRHQYKELILPMFEYVDLFKTTRHQKEESMFQFMNRDGKRIALRADFTVPIARLYHNENTDEVRRYCYFGEVFRMQERHKGRSSEHYQAGIELIGKPGEEGDQECLSLIEETMDVINMKDLKLELGNASFYLRLMELVQDEELSEILEKKAISEMKRFVEEKDLDEDLKEMLINLPSSFGSIDDLKAFKVKVKDKQLLDAITSLEELYLSCDKKEDVMFDLCMVPNQSYYTGVMMKVYSRYSEYPILSGGRYDRLMNNFDTYSPAIGFSYHINTLLNAYEKEGETND